MQNTPDELSIIYQRRFTSTAAYRNQVWQVLTRHFFNQWVKPHHHVLDLGCGYGEFINNIPCAKKWAMDLNPDVPARLNPYIIFLQQNCAAEWTLPPDSLDVVFTSNFFEHLPDKSSLSATIRHAHRCLKPGGLLIAMGPNVKFLHGQYWDFYDHHVYLTETSLSEALETERFAMHRIESKFLPYTMVHGKEYPLLLVRLYLAMPLVWRFFGKQFLVIARKPA